MKIELYNISVSELIDSAASAKLFNNNKIYTALDLYNAVTTLDKTEFSTKKNLDFLKRSFILVQTGSSKYNFLDEIPKFETFNADLISRGEDLPILSLHMHYNVNFKRYGLDTISEIKHDLTSFDSKGRFVFEQPLNSLKMRDVQNLIELIKFYDSYAILNKENGVLNDDFLNSNFELKRLIISKNKHVLVRNLLSMSDSFIFGNISDNQRKEIMNGIEGYANGFIKAESLLDIIARYSMLSEILSNSTNPTSLKRMVK